MKLSEEHFSVLWYTLLQRLIASQNYVNPRGIATREILNVNLELRNPLSNFFASDERALGYKFMIAEWLWIWFGHSDVSSITQYNKKMSDFSDDGESLFGAYGPRVRSRWPSIVRLLKKDSDSRQAVIQIYRTPVGSTKDVACTLTAQYLIRDGRLSSIINMRSSDVWLGLPYDFFMFSMLQNTLAVQLGVELGSLYFNLGSSHLYASNLEAAKKLPVVETRKSPLLPGPPPNILENIFVSKDRGSFDYLEYPWNLYALALTSRTNKIASNYLEGFYK